MSEVTRGKASRRRRARRRGSAVVAVEQKSAWPHGERSETSRLVTCVKEVGILCKSRAFPRSVREVRVFRSKRKKLRQTRESEFRVRLSVMPANTFDRISSGRWLTVVSPFPFIADQVSLSGKTIFPSFSFFRNIK